MSQFEFTCPHCSTVLTAETEWIGQQTECPSCGKAVTIHKPAQPVVGHVVTPSPTQTEVPSTGSPSAGDTKQCPFCAEIIKAKAVKCRFCGKDLVAGTPASNAPPRSPQPVPPPPTPTAPASRKRFKVTAAIVIVAILIVTVVVLLALRGSRGNLANSVTERRLPSNPKDMNTALRDAVRGNDLAKVKELLTAGADVNAKDNKGQTALMLAASQSRTEVMKTLIAAGADVNAKDNDGQTAMSIAKAALVLANEKAKNAGAKE